jgi:methyl-accepting chemotaxis protein
MNQSSAREAIQLRLTALEKGTQGEFNINPTEWFRLQTEKINLLYEVESSMADQLKQQSAELIRTALLQLIMFSFLTLFSAGASLVILFVTAGNVQNRTGILLKKMQEITEGNLTIRLSAHGKDEIAQVEINFNELAETLHDLISQINQTVITLSASSAELLQTSTVMASEMEESSIQAMNISAAVTEMNQTLENVSASVEEMSITIGEVAKRASDAANGSREADKAAGRMESLITELGSSTRQIGGVMESIGTIADQTNLLALNAAIEAAGAGNAGRGFAVVASEVKELAIQSGQFSRNAKEQIGKVLKNVDQSVSAVGEIVKTIRSGMENVVTIAAAVEEQSVAVKEISGSVAQISTASNQTAANVAGIATAARTGALSADTNVRLAKALEKVAAEVKNQISRFHVKE